MARGRELVPAKPPPPKPAPEPEEAVPYKKSSLIEFSTEARDDPNEGLEFGDSPKHCVCPHCERSVITFLDHEASWVTWLLAFIVWFSLGWMALWVLPLLWPAFKDVVHHCPRCLNVIARQSRIKLPTFRSEVMTIKVGSCAVVLARKYVMIFVGLVLVLLTVCVMRSTISITAQAPGDSVPKGKPSSLMWEDFMAACGPRQSMRYRSSTARAFEEKYRKRTFKWEGEVMLIREGFSVFMLKTKSVVMVRMYPQRFPRRDIPDIALLFGEERNREVSTLSPGDWIKFEATMTSHGHRGDPEVMMMWHVALAPKPDPLSSSPVRPAIEAHRGSDGIDDELERGEASSNPAVGALVEPLQNLTAGKASSEGKAATSPSLGSGSTDVTNDGSPQDVLGRSSNNQTLWS